MSVQTVLAAGFLLLGGILFLLVSSLDFFIEWLFPFGLLFILIGAIPLVIQLAKAWLSWYQKSPVPSTDDPKKED